MLNTVNKKCNMISKHVFTLVVAGILIISTACVNENKQKLSEQDLMKQEDSVKLVKTFYKLPSPIELFVFLFENEARFDKKLLNPTENASKYLTTKAKALNFGIYAADMGYCVVFEQYQETFGYFSLTKKLAEDLELNQGFGEEMAKRVQSNLTNIDSLTELTTNSYWEACNFLEKQDKLDLLAVVLTGSWIESLYIAVNTPKKFNPEDPILIRVSEQGILLDNLVEFINLKCPEMHTDLVEKLSGLRDLYDMISMNDDDTIITEQQFKEIKAMVNSIRKEFVL